MIECCKYEPASRPEAKLIVRGLKELYQVVKTREGVAKPVTPPSSAVPPPAAPAAAAAAAAAVATPALSPASLEGDSGTSKPKQLRSSSNASGAPPSPRKQVGNGPYVGLTANEHDEASSSASPNENGLFRNVVLSSAMLTKEGRLRWVQFQDAHPSQCEGFLKLAFGETAKPSKYYAVLMLDVLYYFKSNKKGEKNIGRLLLDHKLQVAIQDVGGKKFELRIKTGTEEVIRCVLGSMDELKTWNTVMIKKKKKSGFHLEKLKKQKTKNKKLKTKTKKGSAGRRFFLSGRERMFSSPRTVWTYSVDSKRKSSFFSSPFFWISVDAFALCGFKRS